jgi:sugar lactone lactonase YvrE
VITTLAGNGSASFSCKGGPGANASFSPRSLAFDAKGNLYVGDWTAQRVCKITPLGLITTVAGNGQAGFSGDGGPAINASLDGPRTVAADAAGNLYIADAGNDRVRKVDLHGVITTIAGNGQQGFSGDGGPATSASLSRPNGVVVDAAGNLYIADTANARIRKVDVHGIITTIAGNGQSGFSGDGGPATSASLRHPDSVVVDADGNLYIADTNNMAVRKVDPANMISTVAGNGTPGFSEDGGPAVKASLSYPIGLTVDGTGNLYIADTSMRV